MRRDRVELIRRVQQVISTYRTRLTIRQLHYRIVAQQWKQYPNTTSSYRWLALELGKARIDGVIPWTVIEDRTRKVHQPHTAYRITRSTYAVRNEATDEPHKSFTDGFFKTISNLPEKYNIPIWWHQPKKLMIFVEKEALSSLFQTVTDEEAVDLVVCRGYPSLSLLYEVSEVLFAVPKTVEELIVLYFGDFDPSGMNIEESASEHLTSTFDVDVSFERIALTKEQVIEYELPPAPTKSTDSRQGRFLLEQGVDWQVELDAIEPDDLAELIQGQIQSHIDPDIREERDQELERRRKAIRKEVGKRMSTKV